MLEKPGSSQGWTPADWETLETQSPWVVGSELRIHFGPGYRVYFAKRKNMILLLLCGGKKSSQSRDIACAKALLKEIDD